MSGPTCMVVVVWKYRVEVEVQAAKNMNPGIRDLGSDAMTSPYPTTTVSWQFTL